MDSQEINKFIKENVDKIYDEMVKVRRIIHENPELGDEEIETSKLIKKFLTENGIEFFEIINTGVVATIYNDKENMKNKTVATRADIDALPILEENEVEYKSKNISFVNFWKIKQIVAVFIKNDWIWTREARRYIKKLMKIFIFQNKISNLFSNLLFSKKYFLRFKRFSRNKS